MGNWLLEDIHGASGSKEDCDRRELEGLVSEASKLRSVADRQRAEQTLAGYLTPLGQVTRILLGEGEAFGIRTSVKALLSGPVRGRELR